MIYVVLFLLTLAIISLVGVLVAQSRARAEQEQPTPEPLLWPSHAQPRSASESTSHGPSAAQPSNTSVALADNAWSDDPSLRSHVLPGSASLHYPRAPQSQRTHAAAEQPWTPLPELALPPLSARHDRASRTLLPAPAPPVARTSLMEIAPPPASAARTSATNIAAPAAPQPAARTQVLAIPSTSQESKPAPPSEVRAKTLALAAYAPPAAQAAYAPPAAQAAYAPPAAQAATAAPLAPPSAARGPLAPSVPMPPRLALVEPPAAPPKVPALAPPIAPSPVASRPPAVSAPAAQKLPAGWVPPGSTVNVHGHDIPDGMLYVGTPARNSPLEGEPALVDPTLAVSVGDSTEWVPDLDYGPRYREIRPRQRGLYLRWLAGGRKDPRTPIGYVFLFFYGLERRLVIDGPEGLVSSVERGALIAELRRLLDIYGQQSSFRYYATELVELAECAPRTTPRRLEPPPAPRDNGQPSLALRLGLGEIAAEAVPLPAAWALAWLDADVEVGLPTPARRCRAELERLFAIRYAQQHGAGIKVHPSTRSLSSSYSLANPGFRGTVNVPLDVPDVFALTGPRKKIAELALACSSELDSFSRFVGKRPEERSSIEAIALLPMELAAEAATDWTADLIASLDGPAVTLPTSRVFRGKIAKDLVIATQRVLEAKELGMEPDPRRGGPLPKEDGHIVLFRLVGPEAPATTEYVAMALLLQVAVTVAAADGNISDEEVEHLQARIDTHLGFGPPERARLRAHLQWLVAEKPGLTTLKKKLGSMTSTQRDLFADFLVGVAWADGAIATEEVKLLSKLFPLLGLDTAQVHRRIHAHAAANTPGARAPVKVASGTVEPGFAIPKPKSKKHPGGLDADLIAEKEAESAAVQDLLSSIFGGDEEPEASPPPSTVTPEPPSTAGTLGALSGSRLSADLTEFARALAARPEWTKGEVDAIARERGLMAGGALEKINDVAFDVCDQPFAIGDDPIEIDAAVLEEILS